MLEPRNYGRLSVSEFVYTLLSSLYETRRLKERRQRCAPRIRVGNHKRRRDAGRKLILDDAQQLGADAFVLFALDYAETVHHVHSIAFGDECDAEDAAAILVETTVREGIKRRQRRGGVGGVRKCQNAHTVRRCERLDVHSIY